MDEVKEILRSIRNLDVNQRNDIDGGSTALHNACNHGHDSIVAILLAHPDIDVNQKNNLGGTPFMMVCRTGKPRVFVFC